MAPGPGRAWHPPRPGARRRSEDPPVRRDGAHLHLPLRLRGRGLPGGDGGAGGGGATPSSTGRTMRTRWPGTSRHLRPSTTRRWSGWRTTPGFPTPSDPSASWRSPPSVRRDGTTPGTSSTGPPSLFLEESATQSQEPSPGPASSPMRPPTVVRRSGLTMDWFDDVWTKGLRQLHGGEDRSTPYLPRGGPRTSASSWPTTPPPTEWTAPPGRTPSRQPLDNLLEAGHPSTAPSSTRRPRW